MDCQYDFNSQRDAWFTRFLLRRIARGGGRFQRASLCAATGERHVFEIPLEVHVETKEATRFIVELAAPLPKLC
jgi:hypothetical protein